MSRQLANDAISNPVAVPARAAQTSSPRAELIRSNQAPYPDLIQILHRVALWLATLLLCVLLGACGGAGGGSSDVDYWFLVR